MTHTTAETMPVAGKKTKASLKGLSPRRRVYEVGMRALIYAAAALVVALLLFLLLTRDPRLLRAVITPGVAFVALTLLRKWCNAPRPYEVLDITPLILKDTRGNSFPSRHVFSVFVIDMAFWWIFPPLGGVFLAVGVLIALIRVIGGVHFPRDVLAGAIMGAACGAVGFWLIP